MGKPKGFIEIDRQTPPTRPVEERLKDWREVLDAELATARSVVASGVPRASVYETISRSDPPGPPS